MYRGYVIPYVAGQGGYNANDNIDAIPPTELIEARNIRFDGNVWRKVGGLTAFDSNAISGTPTALAGFDWWPTASVQRQISVWSDGNIYKEVSGDVDSITLASGFTYTNPVQMLAGGQEIPGNSRKLFIFHQGTVPHVLSADGATTSAITNVSPNWSASNYPAGGIMHDNRIATFGNPGAPHSIDFSAIDDHTNFASSDPGSSFTFPLPSIEIAPGEGEYISGLCSVGVGRLLALKYPAGIYQIDTTALTQFWTPVSTMRTDIGMAGPNAICRVGELGTWFVASDGHIYLLDMLINPDVDIKDACITQKLNLRNWLDQNVNFSRIKHTRLVYDPDRKEVHAYYTFTGGTSHNRALVFNVQYPDAIRVSVEDRGSYFNAAWLVKSSNRRVLYVAGNNGKIYKANQASRSIDGVAYYSSFQTPHSDLGWLNPELADVNKRFDWLEIRSKSLGAYPVSFDVYIDGSYYNTYSFTNLGSGSPLDDAAYGLAPNTSLLDFTLAGDSYVLHKIKIGGIGKTISLKGYNNGAGQDFAITQPKIYGATLGSVGEV